jgi:hypothetical protein
MEITPSFSLSFGRDYKLEIISIDLITSATTSSVLYEFPETGTTTAFTTSFYAESGYTHNLYITALSTFFNDGGTSSQRVTYNLNLDFIFTTNDIDSIMVDGNDFNLGDIKQIDFVKDVCNRYGLILNKLIFEQDRHSLKTPNLKLEKPFGFRNRITISV